MKYIRLFENFDSSEIEEICKQYKIENYIINPDGSIDVKGDVFFSFKGLTKLPLKFNSVSGSFHCANNELTSLEGCPNYISDNFRCDNNNLTSFDGFPKYVGGYINCGSNLLTNLDGCPDYITAIYYNPITPIIYLFDDIKIYLNYQETYNFLRKDCKIVKHLLIEAVKDYNDYYNKNKKLPEEIKGYTYI
mgnify:FL=1|jgi:hypothetical protein